MPSPQPLPRLIDSPDPDFYLDFRGGEIKPEQRRLFLSPGFILWLLQAGNASKPKSQSLKTNST